MPKSPELAAGNLDRRVTLLKPVYNDPQDEITGWESAGDVWASIHPVSGVEGTEANRTIAMVYAQIQIRYRSDVDQRWRIAEGPTVYEIEGQVIPLARRAGLRMNCKEVR